MAPFVLVAGTWLAMTGCSAEAATSAPAEAPPAPDRPTEDDPAGRLRCGVDDDVRPPGGRSAEAWRTRVELDVEGTRDGSQPITQDVANALSQLEVGVASCERLATTADEGGFALHATILPGGLVSDVRGTPGTRLGPLARCAAEVLCKYTLPALASRLELRIPVRVESPSRRRDITVETTDGAPDFSRRMLQQAAWESAPGCAVGRAVPAGSRADFTVTLWTGRSMGTLRRTSAVTDVKTSAPPTLPPETTACVAKRLSELAWGDRHAPAGVISVTVGVTWGELR